ncbi:Sulfotransferase family protein [Solimonas aquatica]|uniref:Sulfotransferase family protein n=1 Tax=Solimonas aquatica TaxID=489703 RepID=A0A1H9EYR2_9GAMM|nr:sulfotransferase [Solimonas aquatica]SEQ30759.1 Sulfotransferase family protein [Solimonas aquatica]
MSAPISLDPDSLLAEASTQCGGLGGDAQALGDASAYQGLCVLCESLNREAQLSDTGRYLMRQKLVAQLANRLRIEQYFRQHPEIAQEQVAPPVVIGGLPRTGTTKLHRLLSRDPRFYWMAFWESQFPVPFAGESLAEPNARIGEGRALCAMMTSAMPKLVAIHPMDADEADEEVMLTEHSFLSAFNAYAHIPSYMRWLDAQDQTVVYQFLRRCLQFLQWQKRQRGIEAQRWVLKAPHHLLRMHLLLKLFPDARVILTHRDPAQSIPSIASFIHTLWAIYSDKADAQAAGAEWSTLMRRALDHTMQVRQSAPDQFFDVQFRDTVKQPMSVVRDLYHWLGLELDKDTAARMQAWLQADEKTHQGGHEYTPEQFGLSVTQLERDFSAYRQRHVLAA